MTTSRVQTKRTSVNDSPPTDLLPGELGVEMGVPTRLWVGVPASADPTKKKLLVNADQVVQIVADLSNKADAVHTHDISDVTDLQAELDDLQNQIDNSALTAHTHEIADVNTLQASLDGKADVVHRHAIGEIDGLRYELDMIEGIAASGNMPKHSHQIEEVLGLQTALDAKSNLGHTHDFSQLTGTPPTFGAHTHDFSQITGALPVHTHTEADITGLGALARKNTVASADIDNGAITQSKLAPGAIGTTEIADNSVNGAKIAIGGDTAGDTLVYDGTNWTRLPAGVSGQVLQTFGPTKPPQWVNPPATLNNVQIAGRLASMAAGNTHSDVSIVNGPYSAYRVAYKISASIPNTTFNFHVQVFDGTTWGGSVLFDSLSIASTSKSDHGEFWILGCALAGASKTYVKNDHDEAGDSIATGLTTVLRFTKTGGSLSAVITGFK